MTIPSITRDDWLDVLAHAPPDALRALGARAAEGHTFSIVLSPKVAMTRVRTPAPGHDRACDVTQAPLACAAVRLRGSGGAGTIGVGYRPGRDLELARCMAQLDALLQHEPYRLHLVRGVVEPLREWIRRDGDAGRAPSIDEADLRSARIDLCDALA